MIEVVVTAEDGLSTKAYTISIQCLSSSDAFLYKFDVSAVIKLIYKFVKLIKMIVKNKCYVNFTI